MMPKTNILFQIKVFQAFPIPYIPCICGKTAFLIFLVPLVSWWFNSF